MKEPISPERLYEFLQMAKGTAKAAEAIRLFGIRGVDVLTLLEMQKSVDMEHKEVCRGGTVEQRCVR